MGRGTYCNSPNEGDNVKSFLTAMILTACLAPTAFADLEIVTSTTNLKSKPETTTGTMMMGKDRFSGGSLGNAKGDEGRVIFRGDLDTMYFINDKKKEYSVFDREMMEKLAATMSEAKAKMDEALANVPEAQRAMVEKLMKKNPAMQAAPERSVTKTGETMKVGAFDCTRYDVMEDGVKVEEVWAAPWKSAGFRKDDFAAFEQLGKFMEELMASTKDMTSMFGMSQAQISRDFQAYEGIPILTRSFKDGKAIRETKVESIAHKDAPAGTYDVDESYKRKDILKD